MKSSYFGMWFRVYDSSLHDPKIQNLSPVLFKFLFNLWCVASKNEGEISIGDLDYHMRMSKNKSEKLLKELVDLGMVDQIDDEIYSPHNWSERQYESDNSTPRVKAFRDRKRRDKEVEGNGSETLQETFPNVSSPVSRNVIEAEAEAEKNKRLVDSAEKTPSIDLAELWKTLCPSLPQIRELTPKRKNWLRLRLKEHPNRDWWIDVMEKVESSEFCKGVNAQKWRASFDWLIENPDNAVKVSEGKYHKPKLAEKSSGSQKGAVLVPKAHTRLPNGKWNIPYAAMSFEERTAFEKLSDADWVEYLRHVKPSDFESEGHYEATGGHQEASGG